MNMTQAFYTFKPENFKPLREGTILRYLGHDYKYDYKEHVVVMEVLGLPPEDVEIPNIQFV